MPGTNNPGRGDENRGGVLEGIIRFAGRPLPGKWEWALWAFLILVTVFPRAFLNHILGCYLWSGDSGSYCRPVFNWLDTGIWDSDPRRGPVYSLFVAAVFKFGGDFDSLMTLQHWLGGLSVLAAIGILRLMHGGKSWFPLAACGFAYAVYAGPISMEHIVRNEILLFAFATVSLGAWYLALRTDRCVWLAVSGVAATMLTLTKNVFLPFPLVVIGGIFWLHRSNRKHALAQSLVFLAAVGITLAAGNIERILGTTKRPPEPQSGILLFGRVAQFTVLDTGIEPGIKSLIRKDIEDYRTYIARERRLNNNLILKKTAVPRMKAYLEERGGTPSELNRLCRRLAIEAIMAHPVDYLFQVCGDISRLLGVSCSRMQGPDKGAVTESLELINSSSHPAMDPGPTMQRLGKLAEGNPFFIYQRVVDAAWIFQLSPALLTTLLIPLLVWRIPDPSTRVFWVGCGVLWIFTLILLSTVGRPMNRYMLPVTPVMFWTLSAGFIYVWRLVLGWSARLLARSSTSPEASLRSQS